MDLEKKMRDTLVTYMVQRLIFCPVTGSVLDVRTCGVLVDADGDPAYVCSPEAYAAITQTPEIIASLASKGLHIPA
jgi:hypothetical protein